MSKSIARSLTVSLVCFAICFIILIFYSSLMDVSSNTSLMTSMYYLEGQSELLYF